MANAKQVAVSGLVLLLAAAFLAVSYQLPGKGQDVPVLVGWVAVVLCALDVVAQTPTAAGRWIAAVLSGAVGAGAGRAADHALPAELRAFGWVALACAGVIAAGFLVAVPIFVFVYMIVQGRKPVVQSGLTALAATLFLWIAFELLLEYEIFRGLLFTEL